MHHGVSQTRHSCTTRDTEICVLPYVRETSRSLRWECIVELPPPRQKEERKAQYRQRSLSSRPRSKAHTRGHPCRECWRAGRTRPLYIQVIRLIRQDKTRPLARHAPGACHQQGASRHVHIRERLHKFACVSGGTTGFQISPSRLHQVVCQTVQQALSPSR